MLEWLRAGATSWVAKLLIGLLVISFAAWGVGDMLRGGSSSAVATIADEEITVAEFQREFELQLARFGGQVDPVQARALGVDQTVLLQMAARVALDQETRGLGIDAPDAEVNAFIREAPAFQNAAGVFDEVLFDHQLRNTGLRRTEFYESVREDLARQVLLDAVMAGASYPRAAAEAVWIELNETRTLSYVTLDDTMIDEPAAPTEAELAAFHQDEAERFTAPEYRTIRYLWLRAEERADPASVSDDEIQDAYQQRIEEFRRPERRNVEQVMYDDKAEADAAAARVADGESFDVVAADRGLAPADIALGYVTRDDLFDPAIADAAFGDATEGLIGPVETDFGFALLNIDGVIPAEETTADEARETLARDLALDRARSELPDLANAIEDMRAGGAGLLAIGLQEGLLAQRVTVDRDGFDRSGQRVTELPLDPSFFERAFEMEIGEEMDLAELPNLEYFAVEVEEVIPSALRPLESVRGRVEAAWVQAQKNDAVADLAATLIDRLDAGDALDAIGEEVGRAPERIEGLSRNSRVAAFSPDAAEAAFAAEPGAAFEAPADGSRRIVAVLEEIVQADPADGENEITLVLDRASIGVADDILSLFRDAALSERSFEVNPNAISAAADAFGYGGHGGM